MKEKIFDTVVVGSGTAAYYVIHRLCEAGQKVAVVDERELGGTCALRGCQPKKYLVAHGEALAGARHLSAHGVVGELNSDWAALQAHKNAFTDKVPDGTQSGFEEAGAMVFRGSARMTSPEHVTVGQDVVLKATNIVLATGALPRRTEIPGSRFIVDSEHFLSLAELPQRLVFVGGGFISFEFAHVACQAGAQATILHRSARPLKAFETDLVSVLLEASRAEGIGIELNESPASVERTEDGFVVLGKSGKVYPADLVVEATGRLPNLSALESGMGEVETSPRGVVVNEYQQSVSNPRVYAVGDCAASGVQLAPVADKEGEAAALNILQANTATVDTSVLPSAVFTVPTLASVGLTEEQAVKAGADFRMNHRTTTGWPSSKRIGEHYGAFKVLIARETETILGAHILRHNAAEVINIFALAMKHGITAPELAKFPWAYPTYSSDLKYMVR